MNISLKTQCFSLFITCICLHTSCSSGEKIVDDLSYIQNFHESVQGNQNSCNIDVNSLNPIDLYVDYSTCVSEAIQSPYYQAIHPVIVDCNPIYYSIKGKIIKEETRDRQMVYQLLRSVREVNNADIKEAVKRIVNGNRQAVLITDGEYFMPGVSGDNLNNPYLAESFRIWLKKGHDIYIYSEPYLESKKFNKFRYYILFTDKSIENNIQQKFSRSAPSSSNVKMFHMATTSPQITFDQSYPQVNSALSMNDKVSSVNKLYELEEFQTDWENIYTYLKENAYDEAGNIMPKGDYVLRGLYLNSDVSDAFKINELDVKTYNIYSSYSELKDSITVNGQMPKCVLGPQLANVFTIDNDIYNKSGEIVLRLHPDFDGSTLSYKMPNLLRVDIYIKKSIENFSTNNDINQNFKWTSISYRNGGKENTSLYESIRQVLIDPQMSPENNDNIVYTIYLNTFKM